jgi:hypothetical protein
VRVSAKAWTGVCSAFLVAGLVAVHQSDARAAASQSCDASAYKLSLQSLTGPPRADLNVRIASTRPDCELPQTLTSVQVALRPFKRSPARTSNFANVPSPGGVAIVKIGRVARHRGVRATVAFGPQIVLSGKTRTLVKPDLVLISVKTVKSVVVGKPFFVVAQIRQRTRDVAATATVSVTAAGAAVGTDTITVRPRRRVVREIPVTLPATPGRTQLTVTVGGSDPVETTVANNARRATVEAVEFKVQTAATLAASFAGYGGQFNHHVYAAISRSVGVTDQNVGDMERKMRELHPEFSRIFFTPVAFTDPDRMQSFVRTVLLAQSTGTTINITWQGGTLSVASGTVQKFADVLIDLVRNKGVTNLRWLTLQNEPNRTKITMEAYEAQYRALDPYISSIRGQVKYMGGDLVRGPDTGAPNQDVWFQYLATHMADILDAYSIHVFWDYWDTQKLVDRLTEVRAIVDALPESGRKPLYVTEYGVRGQRTFNGAAVVDPGVWTDGTPITQTNVSAFQHAWFDVLAARLGYQGTSKWDSYFGKYDNGTQAYYMIGSPQDGWPLYPLYNLVQLMTATVKSGWRTVNVDAVPNTSRLLAAYVGKEDERTVIGLDTAGAQLNTATGIPVSYSIGGLPPSKTLSLALWNEAGDGARGIPKTLVSDANGVVNITVPQHAVFVVTTLRLA